MPHPHHPTHPQPLAVTNTMLLSACLILGATIYQNLQSRMERTESRIIALQDQIALLREQLAASTARTHTPQPTPHQAQPAQTHNPKSKIAIRAPQIMPTVTPATH